MNVSVFAEVETRRDLREAFGQSQRLASEKVTQSNGTVFFNEKIMIRGPEFPKSFLLENIIKFFAEHCYNATSRLAYLRGNEWFHPDGQPYRGFFDRAVEYHAQSSHLAKRFSAESDGYDNAAILINQSLGLGLEAPELVIASSPADVYSSNDAFTPRDVYHLLRPICERVVQLGARPEMSYLECEMIAVPGPATTTEDQWNKTIESADLDTSLVMLGIAVEMTSSGDPNFVVSTPLILKNIERLVRDLGYEGLDDLKSETDNVLALENDPLAVQRRQDMIEYFTENIWGYVSRRHELTEQDELKLKSVCDVMHRYFSLEGGFEYIHKKFTDIQKDIEGHTLIEYRNTGVNFSVQELKYDWNYAELAYNNFFLRLANNPRAQESYSNSGCPVNTSQSLFGSRFGVFETYTTSYGYESTMTDTFTNIYTESTTTSGAEKECYQCPMPSCGADVYTKNGDTYCVKGHHKGG